jgi:hypothetical protein
MSFGLCTTFLDSYLGYSGGNRTCNVRRPDRSGYRRPRIQEYLYIRPAWRMPVRIRLCVNLKLKFWPRRFRKIAYDECLGWAWRVTFAFFHPLGFAIQSIQSGARQHFDRLSLGKAPREDTRHHIRPWSSKRSIARRMRHGSINGLSRLTGTTLSFNLVLANCKSNPIPSIRKSER